MTTQQNPQIEIEDYTFLDFRQPNAHTVTLRVRSVIGRNLTTDDEQRIRKIIDDLGKWENLTATVTHLFSALKLGQPTTGANQNYEKSVGKESFAIERFESHDENVYVNLRITPEERRRRESRNITPCFPVEEIASQIANIPKLRSFKKAVQMARNEWVA